MLPASDVDPSGRWPAARGAQGVLTTASRRGRFVEGTAGVARGRDGDVVDVGSGLGRYAGHHHDRLGRRADGVKEDASHYGDVSRIRVSWAYETSYLEPHVEPVDVVVDSRQLRLHDVVLLVRVLAFGFVLSIEPDRILAALLEPTCALTNSRTSRSSRAPPVPAPARSSCSAARPSRHHATNRDWCPTSRTRVVTSGRWTSYAHAAGGRTPTVLKIDVEAGNGRAARVNGCHRQGPPVSGWSTGPSASGPRTRPARGSRPHVRQVHDHRARPVCSRGSTSAVTKSSPTSTKATERFKRAAGSSCTASSTCMRRKAPQCDETATTSTASSSTLGGPTASQAGGGPRPSVHVAADRRSQSLRHSQVGLHENSHVERTSTSRQAGRLRESGRGGSSLRSPALDAHVIPRCRSCAATWL